LFCCGGGGGGATRRLPRDWGRGGNPTVRPLPKVWTEVKNRSSAKDGAPKRLICGTIQKEVD